VALSTGDLCFVERQVLAVPFGGLVEAVVPRPLRVRKSTTDVVVVAVLEVLEDLGREELLRLGPRSSCRA